MSLTLTIRIIFGCCPIPQTTPSHAQVAADELEVRLYALGVIYWHKDRLSNVAEWAAEVLSTGNRCLPASDPAAEPLLEGLRQAHEDEGAAILACGMPQDLGIAPRHVADYIKRFSHAQGMPGVKADWDVGRWKWSNLPPRVLCAAQSVALFVEKHRQPLISLMFPVGKNDALSPPLRRGGGAIQSPRKRAGADAVVDAGAAELRASTAEAAARVIKHRLHRALQAKKQATRQQRLDATEKEKLGALAALWEMRARASELLAAERNDEVVAAHNDNSLAAVSLASCASGAQAAVDDAFKRTLASPTIPDKTRIYLMELLSLRMPPSCAAASLPSTAALLGASIDVPPLSVRAVQVVREEIPPISELLAALYVARQSEKGTWIMDATSIDQLPIVTNVYQTRGRGLRTALGFRIPENGTALGELQACANLAADGRRGIAQLRSIIASSDSDEAVAALATIPAADSFGLDSAGSCVMDQCPQAQLMQEMFSQYVQTGARAVDVASALEGAGGKDAPMCADVTNGPCNNHLGATVDRAACAALDATLKEKLSGVAAQFSGDSRVLSGGIKGHLRALYKELNALWYAKGHSSEFRDYLRTDEGAKKQLYLHPPRPLTARFFWVGRAGCRGYYNGRCEKAYFAKRAHLADKASILTDRCMAEDTIEFIGAKRAIGIVDVHFSRDETFMTAGHGLGWGQGEMALMNSLKQAAFQKIAANPAIVFEPGFDPYAEVAVKYRIFAEWRAKCALQTQKSPDGSVVFNIEEEVTRELFHPTDEANAASTQCCLDFLRAWAVAALEKMVATPVSQFLDGGRYSAAEQAKDPELKKKLDITTNSDAAEASFGTGKAICATFPGINIGTANGLAVAIMNGDFDRRGRGNFFQEHPLVQSALLQYGRRRRVQHKSATKLEIAAHSAHKAAKRQSIRAKLKQRNIARCVRALKMHAKEIPVNKSAINKQLGKLDEAGKFKLLKEILSVLNVGWGIGGAKATWTRDRKNVPSKELKDILWPLLASAKKPLHAPCSRKVAVRAVARLGTAGPQSAELMAQLEDEVTEEELAAAVSAARKKCSAIERDEFEREQPESAPDLSAGMNIEIMTKDYSADGPDKMWASCCVAALSDGKAAAGGRKKRKVKAGMVQVEFTYATGEVEREWQSLKPADFSCGATKYTTRIGAWRLDLDADADEEEDIGALAGGYESEDGVDTDPHAVTLSVTLSDSDDDEE
jgi:hypothetical protein